MQCILCIMEYFKYILLNKFANPIPCTCIFVMLAGIFAILQAFNILLLRILVASENESFYK